MVVSTCASCLSAVGLQVLRGTSPFPSFENQATARDLSQIVGDDLGDPPAGIVSDFYGYDGTNWVLLLSRTHPDRIFLAPWGPEQPLDEAAFAALVEKWPEDRLAIYHLGRLQRGDRGVGVTLTEK